MDSIGNLISKLGRLSSSSTKGDIELPHQKGFHRDPRLPNPPKPLMETLSEAKKGFETLRNNPAFQAKPKGK